MTGVRLEKRAMRMMRRDVRDLNTCVVREHIL